MKAIFANAMVVSALLATGVAHADVYSLKLENDIISGGQDGHFTSGLEGFWAFEPEADHWTRNLADAVPGWSSNNLGYVAYRFGHQIYTPEEIEVKALQKDDRPYAGMAYGGVTLFSEQQQESVRKTDTLTIDIGLVGQGAGGKAIQKGVHKITSSDKPEGWGNQLENEPFVNLGYQSRWWQQTQLGGLEVEYGPSVGGAVGNLYDYLSAGGGIRIGEGLSRSISQASIAPTFGGVQYFKPGDGLGWYAFANLEGRYMAHNMLLDGNTFKDSHSVDRENLVGDVQVGLALTWDRWQLSFTNVWRSKEFKEQNESDQFGSLALSTYL